MKYFSFDLLTEVKHHHFLCFFNIAFNIMWTEVSEDGIYFPFYLCLWFQWHALKFISEYMAMASLSILRCIHISEYKYKYVCSLAAHHHPTKNIFLKLRILLTWIFYQLHISKGLFRHLQLQTNQLTSCLGLQRIQKIFFVWGILLDGLYMFPLIPPASNQFGQLNNSRGLLEENIFYSLPFRIFRICLSRFIKLFIQIFVSWDKKKESSLKSSLTRNFWNIVFSFQPVLCINELRPTIKKLTTFHIKRNFILQHSQKIIFVQQ